MRGERRRCSGHLLLPRPLLAMPRRRPEASVPSPSLAALSPPLALSLELTRAQPSPPLATAVATATASPPRRIPKCRLDLLFLLTAPRDAGSPAVAPTPSSSTFGSDDRRRGSNVVQAFPELADPSVRSTVSPVAFSPPPRARSHPLAASSAVPESHHRRAMSLPRPELPPPTYERVAVLTVLPGSERMHQLLLPCSLTPNPSLPELGPPQKLPPSSI